MDGGTRGGGDHHGYYQAAGWRAGTGDVGERRLGRQGGKTAVRVNAGPSEAGG